MEGTLLQLGVGGMFVILALREIRAILADLYVRKKNGNGSDGNGYWQIASRAFSYIKPFVRKKPGQRRRRGWGKAC